MTTTITAATAAEFLSLVPRMLGFHARRSLVLVPFSRSRTLGAMRLDLPDRGDDPDDAEALAATAVGMTCRVAAADGIAVIVYDDGSIRDAMTDAPAAAPDDSGAGSPALRATGPDNPALGAAGPDNRTLGAVPHAGLVDALRTKADACGLDVVDALWVAADAWGSYLDPSLAAHPLDELDDGDLPGLPHPTGDQRSGCELPEVDLARSERVARAIVAINAAVAAVCGPGPDATRIRRAREKKPKATVSARIDPQALAAAARLDDLPALFEEMLAWDAGALDPYDAALGAWCLARPALRDIALVGWTAGVVTADAALAAQLRWERGGDYPAELGRLMWGEGQLPDASRLQAALDVVRHIAAAAPLEHRAGALAACAWLSWALGRSTHAEAYAQTAGEAQPGHGLADIVRTFVAAGHLPDWAFRRGAPSP